MDIQQKYRIHGDKVLSFKEQEGSVTSKVPAGYYRVGFHPLMGHFLIRDCDRVAVPKDIFGSTLPRADRVMKAYDANEQPLGVGLFGIKGAGKSLLSSVLANRMIDRGLPVIDVSDSFSTDPEYLEFLNSIQECAIVFDEFLKHLSKVKGEEREQVSKDMKAKEQQDELLTFFQGTNNTKRLIILIDNNSTLLSDFIRDRPGRMRYCFNYEGIEREVVEALGAHYKLTEQHIEQAVTYATRYRVSFDMINELLREWAEYPEETLEELTSILNVPTVYPVMARKGTVTTFQSDKYTLKNVQIEQKNGDIEVELEYPSPVYGEKRLSPDDYYGEHPQQRYMRYEEYVKGLTEKTLTQKTILRTCDLVCIRGEVTTYKRLGCTFDVKLEENEVSGMNRYW